MSDMWLDPSEDPRTYGNPQGETGHGGRSISGTDRVTLQLKCDGLDAEQLARRSVPPSTLSLLGLVRHMANVETRWFLGVLQGPRERVFLFRGDTGVRDEDFEGAVADPDVVEEAFSVWRSAIADADAWLETQTDEDLAREVPLGEGVVSVRDVLVHMVEEYARHVGHARPPPRVHRRPHRRVTGAAVGNALAGTTRARLACRHAPLLRPHLIRAARARRRWLRAAGAALPRLARPGPALRVYSLLFADHGISASHISLLLILWSATSFVFEVPSGAWADSFDRRHLLVVSAFVYAAGFATWMTWQTFPGFALGFVLWGLSSSLMSGTFESLVYDELVERDAADALPVADRLGPLDGDGRQPGRDPARGAAAGGRAATRWSAGRASRSAAARRSSRRPCRSPSRPAPPGPRLAARRDRARRRRATSRCSGPGLAESRHHPDVRRILLLAAAMVGLTAYDEYFPLVARAHGVTTADIPLLIAITVAGQAVGTALVGRTARLPAPAVGAMLAAGALLVSLGALVTPYAGFVAIGIGYGMLNNAMLVGETRLQDAITGPARATVTSVLGFLEEVVALLVYAAFALGSHVLGFPALVALLAVPVLVVAAAVARHLPPAGQGPRGFFGRRTPVLT